MLGDLPWNRMVFPRKLTFPLKIDGWKLEDDSFPFRMVPFQGTIR